ncbi:MAG TPA: PAS domain-containing sensor histidine kinase [Actinomycetota bacterium]|nr:PAS domain-containing sensor histidine kinase [Actinomycetota bacterium]
MPHPPTGSTGPAPEFQRVLEHLDAIVWVFDPARDSYRFVSEGIRRILGLPPDAWIGPGIRASLVHPDDRARAAMPVSPGALLDDVYRLRAADGSWVWCREIARPTVVEGAIAGIVGLTVVWAPQGADEVFRNVIEHLPAIVYIEELPGEGTQGRLRYVSPQVEPLLGFTPDEWLDDPLAWARQLHPDDRDRVRSIYERIEQTGEPFRAEYRMYARDGSVRWFRDEATVVRGPNGEAIHWQGAMFDVTAEHVVRERDAASDERYRSLLEHIPAIVYREAVRGDELQVVYISPRVEELIGISPEEWVADPGIWMRSIHPDDRARVHEIDRATEDTGEPFAMEYRMVARDGRIVWFRDEAQLVRDAEGRTEAWQGVMIDITARKAAEAGLAEAEARYRALVEQLPAIAYIDPVDREGTVYISPQTAQILGYTPEDWYADPHLWRSIVHPDDLARVEAETKDPYSSTYRLIARDGREVWIHDQARPIYDEAGTLVYWQGLLLDVTEQRRTLELERELDVERLTAERLRAEDEMKTTFLQAVSHDLRTPLAAILGLAVTLEREDLILEPEESRDLAHRIAQNARRLDGMVAGFLDLERLQRGASDLTFEPVDVATLVREIVGDPDLVTDRRMTLDVAPATVEADAGMLARIVENLLTNTMKHTPRGSQIWVRLERTDDGVELIVEDDGPGVPDADKDCIFEPFRQGAGAAAGSGVGLALVARFAELHGGRAWVEDRAGGGASFHVTIARSAVEPRIDLTPFEVDQETPTGSEADNQA